MRVKQLTELMYLAMLVHEHTDYCVFIDYSGHIDKLGIQIRKSQEEYNVRIADAGMYAKGELFTTKRYEDVKKVLTDILDNGEIDYDLCEVEEIITHEYHF